MVWPTLRSRMAKEQSRTSYRTSDGVGNSSIFADISIVSLDGVNSGHVGVLRYVECPRGGALSKYWSVVVDILHRDVDRCHVVQGRVTSVVHVHWTGTASASSSLSSK